MFSVFSDPHQAAKKQPFSPQIDIIYDFHQIYCQKIVAFFSLIVYNEISCKNTKVLEIRGMFSQLFGTYLVKRSVISSTDYRDAIKEQLAVRVKLGTIAIAEGLLTEEQVESINQQQLELDKRFGDIATEQNLLTAEQVDTLLKKQGNPYMQFIQVLMESGKLTGTVLDAELAAFQKDNGFSDQDMEALKNEDIDALIPIFAFSAKPYVTELAGLVIRNLNRFVTRDFYIGRIQHADSLSYRYLAGQKTVGSDTLWLAFAEETDEGAFAKIASRFSRKDQQTVDGETFDAVCEFINVNNGLFASELSKKNISLDMEPVFAYRDQSAKGDFYVLPVYLEGLKIDLLIAVNSQVEMGQEPYTFTTTESAASDAKPGSRGTIVLVDDSRMSRNMLKSILEGAGYSVVAEAADGEEAIRLYQQYRPDIITLDITMPKMDGIEALKKLQETDPSVKAIMITAAGQQAKLIEALKCGAKRFITKPFEEEEILTNIDEVLKNS